MVTRAFDLLTRFVRGAARHPERPAVVTPSESVDYGELLTRVERTARPRSVRDRRSVHQHVSGPARGADGRPKATRLVEEERRRHFDTPSPR